MPIPQTIVSRIHQPEHTGKNRCLPCTVVNLLIAAVLSAILGFISPPLMVGSFALFAGLIYFQGYLIPGTPTLTKRYLPDEVFQLFDKYPSQRWSIDDMAPTGGWDEKWITNGRIDPERLFCDIGVLAECENEDDLCLSGDFRAAWTDRIDHLRTGTEQTILTAILDTPVSETEVSVDETEGAFIVEYDGEKGFYHGRWESRAAFVADMAADQELQVRAEHWRDAEIGRVRLVEGLRVFLEYCPGCDGSVTTREEVVDSCCWSREVIAIACQECGARLFEIEISDVIDSTDYGQ